jgi:hypothetical protein
MIGLIGLYIVGVLVYSVLMGRMHRRNQATPNVWSTTVCVLLWPIWVFYDAGYGMRR